MSELGIEMSKEELTEPQRHKEKLRQIFVHLVRASLSFVPLSSWIQSPHHPSNLSSHVFILTSVC
jgi:hypothetical protein